MPALKKICVVVHYAPPVFEPAVKFIITGSYKTGDESLDNDSIILVVPYK